MLFIWLIELAKDWGYEGDIIQKSVLSVELYWMLVLAKGWGYEGDIIRKSVPGVVINGIRLISCSNLI